MVLSRVVADCERGIRVYYLIPIAIVGHFYVL